MPIQQRPLLEQVTADLLQWRSMTRSELINRLARHQPRLTVHDAALCVDEILGAIAAQLNQGKRGEIRGFGSFSVGVRAPRVGRNPKTDDHVAVLAKNALRFKARLEVRERVDRG